MSETSEISVAALGAAQVLDADGRERTLGEAWTAKPALVVFIRHFG
ncbi:MAG TPA: hypothetical protein VHF22_05360 [Planctomycetota bacterium]|nr:hypothetical protein [Planctomycetota bacterium]